MKPLDLENLPDGCIRVCLTENGFTACTVVSSHHLAEDKRPQLLQALERVEAEKHDLTA